MSVTPNDVVSYLTGIKNAHIVSCVPVTVTIKGKVYPAARYIERLDTPVNTRAWNEGERTDEREMVYCVGPLPACKVHGNVAFTVEGETNEYYVASYSGRVHNRKQEYVAPGKEYHPFGNDFILTPWTVPGQKIDTYARVPYKRVQVTIA
jgi:hypothetical protein